MCGEFRGQVLSLGQVPTERRGAALTDKAALATKEQTQRCGMDGMHQGCWLEDLLQLNRHLVGSNEEN